MAIQQHPNRIYLLRAHPRPIRRRRTHLVGSRGNPHSRAVFLSRERTIRKPIEKSRKRKDSGSLTTTPAFASLDRQATPPTGWQRHPDFIEVTSSTHTQLTA